MKLAVVGKEDLDTLEQWVKSRFEQVPVRSEGLAPVGEEGVRIAFLDSPIGPDQMQVGRYIDEAKLVYHIHQTRPRYSRSRNHFSFSRRRPPVPVKSKVNQ